MKESFTCLALMAVLATAVIIGCSDQPSIPKRSADLNKDMAALKSPDKNARVEAAANLGSLGPKAAPAVPALIENLKHEDSEVRRLAAYALGEIGPAAKSAVPNLKELLNDPVREVVTQTVNSIRAIDPSFDLKIYNVSGKP